MPGQVRRATRDHTGTELPIGARLRAARSSAGLTLAAVAVQAGLTKGFLSRLELADEAVDLGPGDTFTMPGTTPHTWRNVSGSATCEVLWTLVPAP